MPPPPPPTPAAKPAQTLSQSLLDIAKAASARTEEGQQIFCPISAIWDNYLQTDAVRKLPTRLRKPLTALCAEISSVANKHFDAYIKGTYPVPASQKPQPQSPVSLPSGTDHLTPTSTAPPSPPTSYAQAAAMDGPSCHQPTRKPPLQAAKAKPTRPDTRLFVRISPEHSARAAGAFAVLTALKRSLGEHAHLLKEVLSVSTGFALCADSMESLTALESHTDTMTNTINNCKIERQAPWTTYRIDNVPRSVRTLDPHGQVTNNEVTDGILFESICDATGQTPIRAVETKRSTEANLFNTSWSVNFLTDSHQLIPRTLRILGTTTNPRLVTYKPKTVQCTRCFLWHNTRSCSRVQRCRICGAGNHTEETHTTSCTAAKPHSCPARCIHCGGPHPADDLNCPLRPVLKALKTKSQKEAITKASKAARSRAVAAAKCSKAPVIDSLMEGQPTTPQTPVTDSLMEGQPTTPRTPVRERPQDLQAPPTTGPATRFLPVENSNRFTSLPFNV